MVLFSKAVLLFLVSLPHSRQYSDRTLVSSYKLMPVSQLGIWMKICTSKSIQQETKKRQKSNYLFCLRNQCYFLCHYHIPGHFGTSPEYTVYISGQKVLSTTCFLLWWTSLNWFLGHLGRATFNVNWISAQSSQEGIKCTEAI